MLTYSRHRFLLSALLCVATGINALPIQAQTANTGLIDNSLIGTGNMHAENVGVGINGAVNDSNVNNNQNNLRSQNVSLNDNRSVTDNRDLNLLAPTMVSPTQSQGGNAIMMMPRNPLPLPNAALGRSNFGLQFGLQNNPGVSQLLGGNSNALGWFAQAGFTIPFGKIPEPYQNRQNDDMDRYREQLMSNERQLFGTVQPTGEAQNSAKDAEKRVKAKLAGLNAYNYSATSAPKIPSRQQMEQVVSQSSQAKLLAIGPGEAYSRPIGTGDRVGVIEAGQEYSYLGHTRSGWIKVLLSDGNQAWTNAAFEFIKNDYTEIDSLASTSLPYRQAQLPQPAQKVAATPKPVKTAVLNKTESLPTAQPKAMPQPVKAPEVSKAVVQPVAPAAVVQAVTQPTKAPEVTQAVTQPINAPEVTKVVTQPVTAPEVSKAIVQPVKLEAVVQATTQPVKAPGVTKMVTQSVKTPVAVNAVTPPVKPIQVTRTVTQAEKASVVTKAFSQPLSPEEVARIMAQPVKTLDVGSQPIKAPAAPKVSNAIKPTIAATKSSGAKKIDAKTPVVVKPAVDPLEQVEPFLMYQPPMDSSEAGQDVTQPTKPATTNKAVALPVKTNVATKTGAGNEI